MRKILLTILLFVVCMSPLFAPKHKDVAVERQSAVDAPRVAKAAKGTLSPEQIDYDHYKATGEVREYVAPVVEVVVPTMAAKWFGDKTGAMHMERCNSTELGQKFVGMFREKYGEDVAYIACATLNAENGHHNQFAVAACGLSSAHSCAYASMNSAGMDAGLFMINTYYQAKRITKLGGPACEFTIDSRSIDDPCNTAKIAWLHNIDNQMTIIMDIYAEQGFKPWVAYLDKVEPYL